MLFKIIILIVAASALYAGHLFFRAKHLLGKSQELQKLADNFPREYSQGQEGVRSRYLVLGDSTAFGVGALKPEETYPYRISASLAQNGHVEVLVGAKTGARVQDLLRDQLPLISTFKPTVISITIGANDSVHRTDIKSFEKDLAASVEILEKSGAEVLIATTPDVSNIPALPSAYGSLINKYATGQNQILLESVRSKNIKAVDLYANGKLDYRKDKGLYASDLFHPSPKGYSRWADLFIGSR